MIHLTKPHLLASIMEQGLLTGREPELTGDAVWTVPWYGINPVFLGSPEADFIQVFRDQTLDLVEIAVDVEGLELVADLACLVDHGARYDEGYLVWPRGREPEALRPYLDEDNAIEIEFLLDPDHPACKAAIAVTGTAASLQPVTVERLDFGMYAGTVLSGR